MVRVAVPYSICFPVMFFATFFATKWIGANYEKSTTVAFTIGNNDFELAIAVEVAVFGINSQVATTTVSGPLNEAPILIGL